MRRTILCGVLLAGMMIMVMVTASSAFAELPEILEGAPIKFEGTSGLTELLTKRAGSLITCNKDKIVGEIGEAGLGNADIHLEECEAKKLKCESLGTGKPGQILVEVDLALVTLELPTGKLGLGVLVELPEELHIECGSGTLLALVLGSVIGEFLNLVVEEKAGGVLSLFEVGKEYEISFETIESKQVITKCISPKAHCEHEDLLSAKFGMGEEDAALLTTEKIKVAQKAHVDY